MGEQQGAEADQQLEARGGGQEGQLQEVKLPDQDGRQQEPEAVLVDLLQQKLSPGTSITSTTTSPSSRDTNTAGGGDFSGNNHFWSRIVNICVRVGTFIFVSSAWPCRFVLILFLHC